MNKLGDLVIKYKMSDKSFLRYINFLFAMISTIGNSYLVFLFIYTDYLKHNSDNPLIAPLITFSLSIGLKSVFSFIIVFQNFNENNTMTYYVKNYIDGMSAITFLTYIWIVSKGSDFDFLIRFIIVGISFAAFFCILYRIPRKLEEKRNKKDKLK